MKTRVAVLGGGVAGLTAAHELAQRGFQVTVYERMATIGGKARSIPDFGSGRAQRADRPGEHGFRFFPAFYRHIIDSMSRIPYQEEGSVAQNLTHARRVMLARFDVPPLISCAGFPKSWSDFVLQIKAIVHGNGVPLVENLHFLRCLAVMMTSCEERYNEQYEFMDYWDFIGAPSRSHAYQVMLGQGLTRSLVAMQAEISSVRSVGNIFCQMIYPMFDPFCDYDRLLNGPTSDVFIFPWVSLLFSLGVKFELGQIVRSFECDPGSRELIAITLADSDGAERQLLAGRDFDLAISAIPVDGMNLVLSQPASRTLLEAAPALRNLKKLETRWMNGIQFYLRRDVPLVNGHGLYVDTPWALTSISQRQFWTQLDLSGTGDGHSRGILSVDISEWNAKGILVEKAAKDCTRDEVAQETWAQLKRSVNVGGKVLLEDSNLLGYFMDHDINLKRVDPDASRNKLKNPYGEHVNLEPLFINTIGSLQNRPDVDIGMANFFLASDYTVTYTDLATMEAANESGRRCCNSILAATDSSAQPAAVWPLNQPWYVLPWRRLDRWRFQRGLPHIWATPHMQFRPKDKERGVPTGTS